jgi:hypothetical protein
MTSAPSRKHIVSQLRKYTPRTMDRAAAYNRRTDENSVNAVSWVSYMSVGGTRQLDALADALEAKARWADGLAGALAYEMFADKLSFFWHGQFREEFAHHAQPLRMMDWESMTTTMALGFALGWRDQATYQGYLVAATFNRDYHLAAGYDERHRRGHAFMLRLFANWRGDGAAHEFPVWACSVPVYERLMQRWRSTELGEVQHMLLEACDHHLAEGGPDKKNTYHDFGDDRISRVPLEIMMVLRLREFEGLANPMLDHALMEAPFDTLPQSVAMPAADEYMRGTLSRAMTDWPQFTSATSLETVRSAAQQSR